MKFRSLNVKNTYIIPARNTPIIIVNLTPWVYNGYFEKDLKMCAMQENVKKIHVYLNLQDYEQYDINLENNVFSIFEICELISLSYGVKIIVHYSMYQLPNPRNITGFYREDNNPYSILIRRAHIWYDESQKILVDNDNMSKYSINTTRNHKYGYLTLFYYRLSLKEDRYKLFFIYDDINKIFRQEEICISYFKLENNNCDNIKYTVLNKEKRQVKNG